MATKKKKITLIDFSNVTFTRSEVALILGCTPLTIANREKKKIYPEPKRVASSNFRCYSLVDVLYLQLLTFGIIKVNHIYSKMYDKGFTIPEYATQAVNQALQALKVQIDKKEKLIPEVVLHSESIDSIDASITESDPLLNQPQTISISPNNSPKETLAVDPQTLF